MKTFDKHRRLTIIVNITFTISIKSGKTCTSSNRRITLVKEGDRGYIYIEAFKSSHVKVACEDIRALNVTNLANGSH
jgi:hypothetical protein